MSSDGASGMAPSSETRPKVGFRPVTPQNDAGMRTEPPVSEPIAAGTIRAATAAAEPPLDPPVSRPTSHGFRVGPHADTAFVPPAASSCWFVFPTMTAPADRRRRTTAESAAATFPM